MTGGGIGLAPAFATLRRFAPRNDGRGRRPRYRLRYALSLRSLGMTELCLLAMTGGGIGLAPAFATLRRFAPRNDGI